MLEKEDFLKELISEIDDSEVISLGIHIEDEDFKVLNKSQANFFLRKIAELEEENLVIETNSNEEIERYTKTVKDFRDKKISQNNGVISHFTNLLQQFADMEIEKDPKKRSVPLPFGTLSYRKKKGSLVVEDEVNLLNFLKENSLPGVKVTVKESVDKKELKAKIKKEEDGFYIDGVKAIGVSLEEDKDTFSVKLPKK